MKIFSEEYLLKFNKYESFFFFLSGAFRKLKGFNIIFVLLIIYIRWLNAEIKHHELTLTKRIKTSIFEYNLKKNNYFQHSKLHIILKEFFLPK